MFNGYVFVDKLPDNDSNRPAFHIYTRPFDLSTVKLRESLSIYTTAVLRSVMIYDDTNSTVRDSIKIISAGGISYSLELPDGEFLWIKTFACNSKTLNVIILFEYCDRYTLYAGRFIASDSLLFQDFISNKSLRSLMMKNKIDDLFIDATTAHIFETNLKYNACRDIESLVKSKWQGYKFHMLVDDFGYESLILMLAKKDIKIYLDDKSVEIFKRQDCLHYFCNVRNAAQIVLVNHIDVDSCEKRFIDEKIITIAFTSDRKESDTYGLEFIRFSIHPTMGDISYIAGLASPLHIYTIGHSIDFPFELSHLCRHDEKTDERKSPEEITLNLSLI